MFTQQKVLRATYSRCGKGFFVLLVHRKVQNAHGDFGGSRVGSFKEQIGEVIFFLSLLSTSLSRTFPDAEHDGSHLPLLQSVKNKLND
jgi:hypothetical protein